MTEEGRRITLRRFRSLHYIVEIIMAGYRGRVSNSFGTSNSSHGAPLESTTRQTTVRVIEFIVSALTLLLRMSLTSS